jgi:hypothetical protein
MEILQLFLRDPWSQKFRFGHNFNNFRLLILV